jgi:hypothetical protein
MQISRFYLLLKLFALFIALVIGEYLGCSAYFRFVRHSDFLRVDWICVISAIVLCYLIFRNLIKIALKEQIPFPVVVLFFLFFSCLLGCFLRFSLQLANGLLDFSEPETHLVAVTSKKISSFGGSIKEGINPMAHMIYFHDWENNDENCEMLTPQYFYYSVDDGSLVQLTLRRGLFHWPWVEDYQVVVPHRMPDGTVQLAPTDK